MNSNPHRAALIAVGVLGMVAVARLAASRLEDVDLPLGAGPVATVSAKVWAPIISRDSVTAIVSRDPFQVTRRPVLPAYDPVRVAEQVAPPPPRPTIALVGVLDGRSPSAVIEGIPGVESARVVRVGDVVGGLRVKAIDGRRVVITGMDTTWVLEMRAPWK